MRCSFYKVLPVLGVYLFWPLSELQESSVLQVEHFLAIEGR